MPGPGFSASFNDSFMLDATVKLSRPTWAVIFYSENTWFVAKTTPPRRLCTANVWHINENHEVVKHKKHPTCWVITPPEATLLPSTQSEDGYLGIEDDRRWADTHVFVLV